MADHEIDRLNIRVGVTNTTATVRNVDKLTDALTRLETVLGRVSSHDIGDLGVGDSRKGRGGGGKKTSSPASKLFGLTKLAGTIHLAKRLSRVVVKIAKAGSDYTETLNLWETAMGDNLNVATKFVNKMNEAYGVSEKTLMNAQATFKNMLGSLGQISDEVAYKLSEGVTQMALDYASLYNQTFDQAMYKFQAALAGQVRPIRSVSGFDITETTLFQLYRSLGGEKSMRQLTRTEKQLLSIYAIFQQMERSGTVGDLSKTMESYANQTRVASEKMQEILQYSGILLTHAIQESGLLQQVNGYLIFFGEVLKAVAEEYGAIQHFGDPFQVTTDGALAAYDATEKLNNKLLGFDKFRALESTNDTNIGIDQTLLEALSSYDSVLANAGMEAQKIADALKEASGLFNEDGTFNRENWEKLIDRVKLFSAIFTGIIVAKKLSTIKTATEGVTALTKVLGFLKSPLGIIVALLGYLFVTNEEFRKSVLLVVQALSKPLSTILDIVAKLVNALEPLIQFIGDILASVINLLDELGILEPVLYALLGIIALFKVKKWVESVLWIPKSFEELRITISLLYGELKRLITTKISGWANSIKTALSKINKQALLTKTVGISGLMVGIMGLTYIFQNWDSLSGWQKVVGILGSLTAAALGAAMAFGVFHSAWSIGLATAGIIAGIAAIASVIATSQSEIENMEVSFFADGGLPDKGSLFIAGEAGAELVTNMGGGQSGVMNMEQLEQAVARGMYVGMSNVDLHDDRPIVVTIDGQKFFTASRDIYRRNGYDVSRV